MKLTSVSYQFWQEKMEEDEGRVIAELALKFNPGPIREAIMSSKLVIDNEQKMVQAVFKEALEISNQEVSEHLCVYTCPMCGQEAWDVKI